MHRDQEPVAEFRRRTLLGVSCGSTNGCPGGVASGCTVKFHGMVFYRRVRQFLVHPGQHGARTSTSRWAPAAANVSAISLGPDLHRERRPSRQPRRDCAGARWNSSATPAAMCCLPNRFRRWPGPARGICSKATRPRVCTGIELPRGVALDGAGDLFIADYGSSSRARLCSKGHPRWLPDHGIKRLHLRSCASSVPHRHGEWMEQATSTWWTSTSRV